MFAGIYDRDENSRQLLRDALGHEPELCFDPGLQFPAEIQTPRSGSERPYVAVYGHNFPASFRQAVRHWAASRGSRLLSIGYRNDWAAEQHITAGPEDFTRIMAQSAALATNFFHACLSALLTAQPFTSH